VAVATDTANEQHYEVPPEFFTAVLGPRLKYSACWWADGVDDLAVAEERTLELTCHRAGLEDGMDVLELGCGWGSLTLWMAELYPASRIVAVSNSAPQREFILSRAAERGFANIEVVTADMNDFDTPRRFDRAVSLEMFEHMRNWKELYRRLSTWLRPDGRFLQHVFCHRRFAYPYVASGDADWMARHFFTGGIMPSDDQPYHFQDDLEVVDHWRIDGRHYSRTLEAWLDNLDRSKRDLQAVLRDVYGSDAAIWFHRWRIFFMACSELFAFRRGQEWWVSHYLLAPRAARSLASTTRPPVSSDAERAAR
jgi:cyclopropane-fatty-acyl-phospholipid synthase